jgi:hypothetical protein
MDVKKTRVAAPIFIVGSPRSGTSILTWCLGQHPNILPTEESDWLGPFAEQVGAHFELGSARGERSQLSALGVERNAFFEAFGAAIDALILGQRRRLEELSHTLAQHDPSQISVEFAVSRDTAEPKARWVDGTPEYSFHVCGLHKLFPAARFVHILRDADEVATSMLAFRDGAGHALVANADEAYTYWRRTTEACVAAEHALGAGVVHRLRHADLVAQPEPVLRELFAFLGESLTPACLAPLAKRINSSFADDAHPHGAPQATSETIEQARQLSARLRDSSVALPTAEARTQWEAQFQERVSFARNLRADYRRALDALRQSEAGRRIYEQSEQISRLQIILTEKQTQLAKSQRALNLCAILLLLPFFAALAAFAQGSDHAGLYAGLASAALLAYAWLRRAGLRRLFKSARTAATRVSNSTEAIR